MNNRRSTRIQLKRLASKNYPMEEKFLRLLQIGCEYYGLMLGLISEIKINKYHVISAYPDGLVNIGECFELNETICDVTHHNLSVTSFSKASGTDWMTHPAYDKFAIESYIGTNYYIDGEVAGTINFSSLTALGREFTIEDKKMISLFAQTLTAIRTA